MSPRWHGTSARVATLTVLAAVCASVPSAAALPAAGPRSASSVSAGPATASQSRAAAAALTARLAVTVLKQQKTVEQLNRATVGLQQAVSAQLDAQRLVQKTADAAARADIASVQRVRLLYLGGDPTGGMLSLLNATSLADLADREVVAQRLLTGDQRIAESSAAAAVSAAAAQDALSAAVQTRSELADRAAAARAELDASVANQQQLVASAQANVLALVVAEQAAQAQRAAATAVAARAAAEQAWLRARNAASGGSSSSRGPVPASTGTVGLGTVTDQPGSGLALAAVAAALSQSGKPYLWGGTGTDAFDCSGLAQWAYAQAGLAIPRTAAGQFFSGFAVSLAELAPGDLILFGDQPGVPASIYHVAMYIGGGQVVQAARPGTLIGVGSLTLDNFFAAVRPGVGARPVPAVIG